MLKLEFVDQRKPGVWLVETEFRIGADSRNHLVLADDGVSDNHAVIQVEGPHVYLSDLKSYKGTQVNGQPVRERFQLRPGDKITIGTVEFELSESQSSGRQVGSTVKSDWTLMALSGENKGKSYPMVGSMTIGRSNKCDIVVNDEHMSRRHAEVNLKGGQLRIIDLNSSNGTRVNGIKITDQPLKPGDKITFDQVTFLVTGPAVGGAIQPDDDEEDATVFRVAPMPTAAPKPQAASRSAASTASAQKVEAQVTAATEKKSAALPIAIGVVLIVALGIAGAFMAGVV